MANSLRLLRTNERLWETPSGCSWQMSKCERFAQVAQDKLANERIAHFLFCSQKNEQLAQKNSEKIVFLYVFYCFLKKQKICSFLLSEVSKLLRLLRTNERPWAIHSGHSEGMSDCKRIAKVVIKKEQIAHFLSEFLICSLFWQKKSDLLWNLMSKFPTLPEVGASSDKAFNFFKAVM